MADYDTVQEAAGRAEQVIKGAPNITRRFYANAEGVQPLDKPSKDVLDAVNSGVGLSPGDQSYILQDVARQAKGHVHENRKEGGTEITIPARPAAFV